MLNLVTGMPGAFYTTGGLCWPVAVGPQESRGAGWMSCRRRRNQVRVDRQKLIIILVGLPGRGKTFLCNKLMCYLNW